MNSIHDARIPSSTHISSLFLPCTGVPNLAHTPCAKWNEMFTGDHFSRRIEFVCPLRDSLELNPTRPSRQSLPP